jgi:hypothetical protein
MKGVKPQRLYQVYEERESKSRVLTSPLSARKWLIIFNQINSFYACYK